MRKAIWIGGSVISAAVGAVVGVLALDAPVRPSPLASVSDPFENVDISDLPAVQTYVARDRVKLGYRAYQGSGSLVVE